MLEDSQHHSSESGEENLDANLETANDANYCENDNKMNVENIETNGIQDSLAESNEGDVDVKFNSNIVSWLLLFITQTNSICWPDIILNLFVNPSDV